MELQIMYEKTLEGEIEVTISVMEAGDYPTCDIFARNERMSPISKFIFKGGEVSDIREVFPNIEEAQKCAEEFIEKIRLSLEEWRMVETFEPRTVNI